MKKGYSALLFMALILSMVLTACTSGTPEPPPKAAVKEDLVMAINAEPTGLDPATGNDLLTFAVQYQLFDTLIREDQDGNLVPGLAESWEISPDGLEITFKLRKDVKFHNGETMTAKDVVFSFQRAMASAFTSRITGAMKSIEQIDDSTVKLTMKYAYGPVLGCIATSNMGIVSEKAVTADPEGFARNPVGTGPYKFVDWQTGTKLIFTAFEDYYRGPAAIKNLEFRIIGDASTAVVALEKGEVDVLLSPAAADRKAIEANANLAISECAEATYWFVTFNTEEGIFSDPLLRKAVAHAIDKEAVILGAMEGNGTPLSAPIPPGCFGYPEDFVGNEYNPDKARDLLAEAGYPNGLKVTFKTMESVNYSRPAEIIQEHLRVVGIDAELEIQERGAYLKEVYTDTQYEIAMLSVSALVMDADLITYGRFHSSLVGGGNNFTRFQDPAMDAALELGRKSLDPEERKAAYLEVTQIVNDQVPLIPIMSGMRMIAFNKNLQGVKAHPVQKYYVYDWSWK